LLFSVQSALQHEPAVPLLHALVTLLGDALVAVDDAVAAGALNATDTK
jgi:hypothetical protein